MQYREMWAFMNCPTFTSLTNKPKKPKFVGRSPTNLHRQTSLEPRSSKWRKNCPICCPRRWQGVHWYSESSGTKHNSVKKEQKKYPKYHTVILKDTFIFICAPNRVIFASLAALPVEAVVFEEVYYCSACFYIICLEQYKVKIHNDINIHYQLMLKTCHS